ncbi:MAG: bifunctional diaminohydroxyphosphoribosylaminopyrimidine deaminase/5-amino-6-(5-phosphoribosylamino)uracil reductase RibD [Saprospiraceae bacterium]|nr:bifunctional diaminohydroxyphosphoribosylaminopyrimidine deaminase/5-amino-6-(5-phosphoribosylamino)uracil reductase RibD [Saprospiraceae bacterium]
MHTAEKYISRCLKLAKNGLGNVAPNPLVGCVIVNKEKIIGEGYHKEFGGSHAEVNAINSVKDESLLKVSTLYVNLEPCSHHGKTPPCADLIIENKIPKVVIGIQDPFVEVAGKGIEKLRNAGIEVVENVLIDECQNLNKRFLTFHQKKRPYIILKWAETLDGFIDLPRNSSENAHINWITDTKLKVLVHKWRSEEQAIMIGSNTAINDNPKLDVREWSGKNPLRILLDPKLETPFDLNIFDNSTPTLIFSTKKTKSKENTEFIKLNKETDYLNQVIETLYKKQIQSIIIEGGKMLLESFIKTGMWDEARVFIGNKIFTGGLKAPALNLSPVSIDQLENDKLYIFENPKK